MSWDLQIDLATGDLVWDAKRDLAPVQAEELIQQRVHIRLKIDRGSFIYDRSGDLGSNLLALLDAGVPKTAESIMMLIQEALEPMTDISVTRINVYTFDDGSGQVTDPRQMKAVIEYQPVYAGSVSDTSITPPVTTSVTVPI